MTENSKPVPLEPVVLDAEGKILHDPGEGSAHRPFAKARVYQFNTSGILPKILVGMTLTGLLFLGLTIAGVVLGIFFVALLGKFLFQIFFKQTRQ